MVIDLEGWVKSEQGLAPAAEEEQNQRHTDDESNDFSQHSDGREQAFKKGSSKFENQKQDDDRNDNFHDGWQARVRSGRYLDVYGWYFLGFDEFSRRK